MNYCKHYDFICLRCSGCRLPAAATRPLSTFSYEQQLCINNSINIQVTASSIAMIFRVRDGDGEFKKNLSLATARSSGAC